MNDDMKMVIFSDLHYLDDNHKEKTNRKLTKLAIPVMEKLIYKINEEKKTVIVYAVVDGRQDYLNIIRGL